MKAQEKLRAGQEFAVEMNNNNNYVTHQYQHQQRSRNAVLMCHKGTQWEEQKEASTAVTKFGSTTHDRQGNAAAPLRRTSANEREPVITKAVPIEGQQKSRVVLRRGNADEGLTALKIKQLMTTSPRSTDKRNINPQLLGAGKTLNGHVNDLKMRFEDGREMRELKTFQKAVDNVTVVNRFALPRKTSEDHHKSNDCDKDKEDTPEQEDIEIIPDSDPEIINDSPELSSSSAEDSVTSTEEDLSTTIVLRRKRTINKSLERLNVDHRKYHLLPDFGGSVHSLEDILNQQRFSRSLSQYSVSDLCWNESPAEINRDCQRFDELFCRSTEELRPLSHSLNGGDDHTDNNNSSPISKFGSMVDVVNV